MTATPRSTQPTEPGRARPSTGRTGVVAIGLLGLLAAACGGGGGTSSTDDVSGPTIAPDSNTVASASAVAMGDVESVEFALSRSGEPVFIDSFESIALNRAVGQFTVPRSARALLEVEVNGSLTTELGAIALDDEVWLSNPITGDFETLPAGYDIDPSLFFDPQNGWEPLMANLTDVEFVGTEQIEGADRYRITGTAPADQVAIITAGLVRDQDVDIDFWIHPVTALVTRADFTTEVGDGRVDWSLELSEYGADFDISPPDNLVEADS